MNEGVRRQMEAFKEGFESVFSLNQLKIFYPDEVRTVLCFLFCTVFCFFTKCFL